MSLKNRSHVVVVLADSDKSQYVATWACACMCYVLYAHELVYTYFYMHIGMRERLNGPALVSSWLRSAHYRLHEELCNSQREMKTIKRFSEQCRRCTVEGSGRTLGRQPCPRASSALQCLLDLGEDPTECACALQFMCRIIYRIDRVRQDGFQCFL